MKEYGVVLAGGGTRGSYEVGVWKALKELEINIKAVAGTSIGAINGALMVQGDFETAYNLWTKIDIQKVIRLEGLDLSEYKKLGIKEFVLYLKNIMRNGGIDISPLKSMLNEYINEEKIRNSPIDYGLVTFSLTDLKPVILYKENIPPGKMVDYIIASAALPVFKSHEIDNKRFIDGGAYDNRPVSLVVEKGIKDVVVVDVSGYGRVRKVRYDDVNIVFIKNSEHLGGVLDFDSELAKRNIKMGYLDGLKAFGKLYGKRYYINIDDNDYKGLTAPLQEREWKALISFLELKNDPTLTDRLIRYRVIRVLSEYTGRSLNEKTVILAAAEITAEAFGIDRIKVYTLNELANKILSEYEKIRQTDIFKKSIRAVQDFISGQGSFNFKGIDSRYIVSYAVCYSVNNRNLKGYRRLLATFSPKICISSLFLSLLFWRSGKSGYFNWTE